MSFGGFGAPSAFGTSTSGNNQNMFGASNTGAFGATNAFGQRPAATTFGGGGLMTGTNQNPVFGAQQPAATPGSPFGGAFRPATAVSGFGTPSAGGFGSTTPAATGAFGALGRSTSPGTMGGFGTSGTSMFGGLSKPIGGSTSPFGGTSAFGGIGTTGGFGQAPPQQQGFGFQQTAAPVTGFGQGAATTGTGNPPFAPLAVFENNVQDGRTTKVTNYLNVITAMPAYENKSFEELRLEDYQRNNKGGPGASGFGQQKTGFGSSGFGAAATTSPFGAPASTQFGAQASGGFGVPQQTLGFGSTATASNTPGFGQTAAPFGATSTGGFGASAAPAFGTGGFGQASGGFLSAPSATPSFGSSATPFGQTPSGGFGQPTSSFGQQPVATSAFGQPSGSTFGQPASTPAFGSTFGQPAAGGFGTTSTPAFGQAASAFGQPATAFGSSTGGFGQPATATGFGQASTPAFGASSTFGQTSTPAFGSAGSTMFGQPAASTAATTGFGQPSAFGQPSSAFGAQPASGFGQTAFGQTPTTSFGQPAGTFGQTSPGFKSSFGTATQGFGQQPTAFGAPSTSAFGQAQPSTSFGQMPSSFGTGGFGGAGAFGQTGSTGFGAPNAFSQPSTGFGNQPSMFGALSSPPQMQQQQQQQAPVQQEESLNVTLGRKLELLKKKKDSLEINLKKPSALAQGFERSSTYTALSGTPSSLGKHFPARHTPVSSARISPRGFLAKELGVPTTPSTAGGAKERTTSTDSLLHRSAMRLILDASRVVKDRTADLPVAPRSASATPLRSYEPLGAGDKTWLTPAASDSPALANTSLDTNRPSNLFTPAATTELLSQPASGAGEKEQRDDRIPFSYLKSQEDLVSPSNVKTSEEQSIPPVSNAAPTLLRSGYATVPSLSVLRQMTDSELERVSSFTIFRPNVGEICWPGDTDVRGLDLDRIVRIEQNEVIVYEQTDTDLPKPPIGQGLNKRATITLWNVFPKASSSYQKTLQFEAKLRNICDDADSEFHYYDSERGEWAFSVDHFSRYGLVDSDDEEDGGSLPAEKVVRPKSMALLMMKQGTPATAPTPVHPDWYQPSSEDLVTRSRSLETADYATVLSSTVKVRRSVGSDAAALEKVLMPPVVPLKAFLSVEASPTMALLQQVKAEMFALRDIRSEGLVYTSVHGTGVSDGRSRSMGRGIALAMARSFRVGFHPDGLIVHSGRPVFGRDAIFGSLHRVHVEKIDPLAWTSATSKARGIVDTYTEGEESVYRPSSFALDAVLRSSHCVNSGPVGPKWSVPPATSDNMDEYLRFAVLVKSLRASFSTAVDTFGLHHPDYIAAQCIELLDACCGQEAIPVNTTALMPLYENRQGVPIALWERRREFLAQWLQRLAGAHVKPSDSKADSGAADEHESFARIFELLSCRRVMDSVAVAETNGLFRVATLLSQIGGDDTFTMLMDRQLMAWRECDADKGLSPEVLRVYRLLAGEALASYDDPSVLENLDWTQSLCVLFSYCLGGASSLGDALGLLKQGIDVSQARSPAIMLNSKRTDSAIFSLLEVLLDQSGEVSPHKVLRPEGFTGDLLDYRHPYSLALAFESLDILPQGSVCASVVRQHMVTQLLAGGEWEWAVFVLLQDPDDTRRAFQAKDVIARYVTRSPNVSDSREFLETTLKVPAAWIDEALAYACSDMNLRVQHFIDAGCWVQANNTVCFELAAKWIFASESVLQPLLQLLELIESHIDPTDSSWKSSGLLLLKYLQISRDHREIEESVNQGEDIEERVRWALDEAKTLLLKVHDLRLDQYLTAGRGPTMGKAATHSVIEQVAVMVSKLENILASLGKAVEPFDFPEYTPADVKLAALRSAAESQ